MTLPEKFEKFCIDSTDCNGCIGLDCRMCEEMYTAGYKAALEDMTDFVLEHFADKNWSHDGRFITEKQLLTYIEEMRK